MSGGTSAYMNPRNDVHVPRLAFGADGIILSTDGETQYFSVVSGPSSVRTSPFTFPTSKPLVGAFRDSLCHGS